MKSALLILLIMSVLGGAQKSSELSDLERRMVDAVQKTLPNWTHTTVEPMKGSADVAIHHWASKEKVISVTIIRHESTEEATKSIREFAAHMSGKGESPDAGEEQYSLPSHSSIVLRRRNFTFNIDATSTDASEEKGLIKQFARFVADATKDN